MCGLCGAYGAITQKEKNAFSMLSLFSQVRGKDSTGVGLIYNNKKRPPIVAKSVGGQETLALEHKRLFDQTSWTLTEMDLRCIIGHNRWATIGVVNEENAHPFHEGDIIGCHNGTISPHLMYGLDSHDYLLSDSHILMKELGSGKSIEETIKYLIGAWALTWYHIPNRRLHMCRNKERKLFVAITEDKRTMFWASESWMLETALDRCGVRYQPVASVMEDKHLVWRIDAKGVIELDKSTDAAGGKFKPVKREKWWGLNSWGSKRDYIPPLSESKKSNVVLLPHIGEEGEEDYEEAYAQTSIGQFISRKLFEERVGDGCSNCTGDLTWEGRDAIVWADYQSPLCKDCAEWLTGKAKVN